MNAVDALADGDPLKWSAILNLPYETFFLKQLMRKTQADYEKKYMELLEKDRK
ncbi:MAG TPA: hypothetical protein VN922_24630 [Bacteroidia bacterium]|nr:hypothetical protein [Bacteroidia bacterium]